MTDEITANQFNLRWGELESLLIAAVNDTDFAKYFNHGDVVLQIRNGQWQPRVDLRRIDENVK